MALGGYNPIIGVTKIVIVRVTITTVVIILIGRRERSEGVGVSQFYELIIMNVFMCIEEDRRGHLEAITFYWAPPILITGFN